MPHPKRYFTSFIRIIRRNIANITKCMQVFDFFMISGKATNFTQWHEPLSGNYKRAFIGIVLAKV